MLDDPRSAPARKTLLSDQYLKSSIPKKKKKKKTKARGAKGKMAKTEIK